MRMAAGTDTSAQSQPSSSSLMRLDNITSPTSTSPSTALKTNAIPQRTPVRRKRARTERETASMDFNLMLAGPSPGKTALIRLLLDSASLVGPSTSSLSSLGINSHATINSIWGAPGEFEIATAAITKANDGTITDAEDKDKGNDEHKVEDGREPENGKGVSASAAASASAPASGSGREDENGKGMIPATDDGEHETVDKERAADSGDRKVRAGFPPNGVLGPGCAPGLGKRSSEMEVDLESEDEEREWMHAERQRAYEDAVSVAKFIANAEREGKTKGVRKCSVEVYAPSSSSTTPSPTSTNANSKDNDRSRVRLTLIDTPSLSVASGVGAEGAGMDLDPGEVTEADLARLERSLTPVLEFVEERFVESLEDQQKANSGDHHVHLCLYLLDPDTIVPFPSANDYGNVSPVGVDLEELNIPSKFEDFAARSSTANSKSKSKSTSDEMDVDAPNSEKREVQTQEIDSAKPLSSDPERTEPNLSEGDDALPGPERDCTAAVTAEPGSEKTNSFGDAGLAADMKPEKEIGGDLPNSNSNPNSSSSSREDENNRKHGKSTRHPRIIPSPNPPRIPALDLHAITLLSSVTNVLPVLSRSDRLGVERLKAVKNAVRNDLARIGIGFGIFEGGVNGSGGTADDVETDDEEEPDGMKSYRPPPKLPVPRLPHAIFTPDAYSHDEGTNTYVYPSDEEEPDDDDEALQEKRMKKEKMDFEGLIRRYMHPFFETEGTKDILKKERKKGKFLRRFPWGSIDALEPTQSDFLALRRAVFHHMQPLRTYTKDYLFEKFRVDFHHRRSRQQQQPPPPSSLGKQLHVQPYHQSPYSQPSPRAPPPPSSHAHTSAPSLTIPASAHSHGSGGRMPHSPYPSAPAPGSASGSGSATSAYPPPSSHPHSHSQGVSQFPNNRLGVPPEMPHPTMNPALERGYRSDRERERERDDRLLRAERDKDRDRERDGRMPLPSLTHTPTSASTSTYPPSARGIGGTSLPPLSAVAPGAPGPSPNSALPLSASTSMGSALPPHNAVGVVGLGIDTGKGGGGREREREFRDRELEWERERGREHSRTRTGSGKERERDMERERYSAYPASAHPGHSRTDRERGGREEYLLEKGYEYPHTRPVIRTAPPVHAPQLPSAHPSSHLYPSYRDREMYERQRYGAYGSDEDEWERGRERRSAYVSRERDRDVRERDRERPNSAGTTPGGGLLHPHSQSLAYHSPGSLSPSGYPGPPPPPVSAPSRHPVYPAHSPYGASPTGPSPSARGPPPVGPGSISPVPAHVGGVGVGVQPPPPQSTGGPGTRMHHMPHRHHGAGRVGLGGEYDYEDREIERDAQMEASRESYRERENERYGLRSHSQSHHSHSQSGPGQQQTFQFEDGRTSPGDVFRPKHKKITIACNFCRSRKLKCDGGRPTCSQCIKRGHNCDYKDHIRRRGNIITPNAQQPNRNEEDAEYELDDGERDRNLPPGPGPGQAYEDANALAAGYTSVPRRQGYAYDPTSGRSLTKTKVVDLMIAETLNSPHAQQRELERLERQRENERDRDRDREIGLEREYAERERERMDEREYKFRHSKPHAHAHTHVQMPNGHHHPPPPPPPASASTHSQLGFGSPLAPMPFSGGAGGGPGPSSSATSPVSARAHASAGAPISNGAPGLDRPPALVPASSSPSVSAGPGPGPGGSAPTSAQGLGSGSNAGGGAGGGPTPAPGTGEPGELLTHVSMGGTNSRRRGKATGVRMSSNYGPKVVACNFCRARKTKCDGQHPTCQSCSRRNLPCSYVNESSGRGKRGHAAAQAQAAQAAAVQSQTQKHGAGTTTKGAGKANTGTGTSSNGNGNGDGNGSTPEEEGDGDADGDADGDGDGADSRSGSETTSAGLGRGRGSGSGARGYGGKRAIEDDLDGEASSNSNASKRMRVASGQLGVVGA